MHGHFDVPLRYGIKILTKPQREYLGSYKIILVFKSYYFGIYVMLTQVFAGN